MLGTLKKLTGVAVIFGIVFSLLAPGVAYAQTLDPGITATETRNVGGSSITPEDIRAAIDSPTPNLANTTAYIFYTISVIMTGTFRDCQSDPECAATLSSAPNTLGQSLTNYGLVGGIGYLMGEMFRNQPASFEHYALDVVRQSRFSPPAYAQGIGFGALTPILGTWKAFRDVAYYFLTIMFIVTGFLILIRHKISGNMAVTVQNALPRLVLALILITFSYAIAGLIVDLMFIVLYFMIGIFDAQIFDAEKFAAPTNFGISLGTTRDLTFNTHLFDFMLRYIFGGSAYRAADSIGDIITTAITGLPGLGFLGDPDSISAAGLLNWILSQLFALVFAIALFIAMFRVFFQLIMSYVGFVLNVVLSPLLLLEMTIPGRDPWRGWIRNLIAGLLPFVVTVFMIFMALALTGVGTKPGIGYDPENPGDSGLRLPLILAGDISADAFIGILAMGIMLLLPESIKMSQDLIGAKGGPFEQYKDKAVGALKQGWQGTGVVPGGKTLAAGAAGAAGLATLTAGQQGVGAVQALRGRRYKEAGARAIGAGLTVAGTFGVPIIPAAGAVISGGQKTFGGIMKGIQKEGGETGVVMGKATQLIGRQLRQASIPKPQEHIPGVSSATGAEIAATKPESIQQSGVQQPQPPVDKTGQQKVGGF